MTSINRIRYVGLPRPAQAERALSPDFVSFLAGLGLSLALQSGYGEPAGYAIADYQAASPGLRIGPRWTTFQTDLVILPGPLPLEEAPLLRPGSTLLADFEADTATALEPALELRGLHAIALPAGAEPGADPDPGALRRLIKQLVSRGGEHPHEALAAQFNTLNSTQHQGDK